MQAKARAHSNIALVKYWGKRQADLNLPQTGSLSITLGDLYTDTTVSFKDGLDQDTLSLGGATAPDKQTRRVSTFLDLVRKMANTDRRAEVVSSNSFPTGAGLASSASGFAALALAATRAAGVELSPKEMSILARQGSGSAARSLFGGFVYLHRGESSTGEDCFAEPLLDADKWPLEVIVAITATGEKDVGSTEGMVLSAQTSPYYPAWETSHPADMAAMKTAVESRDFAKLAEITEFSCLKMHGLMLSTNPGLLYWNPTTLALIHEVRRLRKAGTGVCFTIDAGPQLKAVCEPGAAEAVEAALRDVPGVKETLRTGLGPDASVSDA